jgi:hypothetical protein
MLQRRTVLSARRSGPTRGVSKCGLGLNRVRQKARFQMEMPKASLRGRSPRRFCGFYAGDHSPQRRRPVAVPGGCPPGPSMDGAQTVQMRLHDWLPLSS